MDVPLLRKLTWKSILGFGKYHDLTVLEVYNLQHTRYLRWCYYNCSKISFTDEVLEKIRVPDKYKIDKPGTNAEFDEKVNKLMTACCDDFTNLKNMSRLKRINKAKRKYSFKGEKRMNRKSLNQARNHGHL